jgi:predicted nucleotidyltransferase
MDRQQMIRGIAETLASLDDRLVAAYLFGSVARGTDRPESDVDVAILLQSAPQRELGRGRFSVEGDLERSLGRPVQIVILNTAPPDLVHRVLRDGELLVERDRSARIAFEVRARNEYFDLLPVLQRYRRREAAPP